VAWPRSAKGFETFYFTCNHALKCFSLRDAELKTSLDVAVEHMAKLDSL